MLNARQNPNPTFLSAKRVLRTSHQVRDYLLCGDCEERFNSRGERWCLKYCDRGLGQFRLRAILASNLPRWDHGGFRVYEAAAIPAINTDALVYFGLSVFWRAAVHTWRTPDGDVNINLGPYAEQVRLFLLDERPFPGSVVITVRISDLGNLMWAPTQRNSSGFHVATFGMLGLVFNLAVGARIPAEFYDMATEPNDRKFVWAVRSQDDFVFAEAVKLYRSASLGKP